MIPVRFSNVFTFFTCIIVIVGQVSNSSVEIDTNTYNVDLPRTAAQINAHVKYLALLQQRVVDSYSILSWYKHLIHPANASGYYRFASYGPKRYRRQNTNTDLNCEIPINPHSVYQIINGRRLDHYAEKYSVLETKCDIGYKRPPNSEKISTCVNGQWTPIPPACLRSCKSLKSTMSTNVTCYYKNGAQEINLLLHNCIEPVEGTTVELSCNTFYEAEAIRRDPIRTCKKGSWTPSLPECYPTCGSKTPKGKVNIISGGKAVPGDYPWQVGLYTNKQDFICGGSVISQNLVLTAAHCIADHSGMAYPVKNYLIAVGKYYRQYNHDKDSYAQYSNVNKILKPIEYKSGDGLYAFDIAILLLENPLEITLGVQPVCIDLNPNSLNNNFLMNHNEGIVTGWGYTQEGQVLSDVLKELVVPFVSYQKCFDEVPRNFRRYLMFDKLCGGYLNNGTSVCGGDSGGALVYNINDRYFVKGIVSNSPSAVGDVSKCDSNQYGLYTSVLKHIDFIRETVRIYGWVEPLECEQDDCTILNTENSCLLPTFPPNGKYSFPDKITEYTPGNYVQAYSAIVLSCDNGYETNSNTLFCLGNGVWMPSVGKCTLTKVGDKSREKCQEYTKYSYEKEDTSHLNCPITEVENVVQLRPAKPKEFPHIASIGIEGDDKQIRWGCLGTLISENFVLSTAQCSSFMHNGKPVQYVQLGDLITDYVEDDARTQLIPIKKVIIHQDYKPPSVYNDIGLIELEYNAILDAYVRPACINTNPNLSNRFGIESGWGRNSDVPEVNKHMQKATLNIFTHKECTDIYGSEMKDKLQNGIVENTQICAGSKSESGVDVCRNGGPLQIVNSGQLSCTYSVIGISSHGKDCGVPNVPGIYTKVSSYVKWIEDIVWPENPKTA